MAGSPVVVVVNPGKHYCVLNRCMDSTGATIATASVVIQQTKHIEVQEDIDLGLPTYINKGKNECVKSNPTSIIMAPNTRKVFSSEVKIKSDEGIVHIGQSNNYL